jgi:type II secretory pathway component GspD/PulD (secretin)
MYRAGAGTPAVARDHAGEESIEAQDPAPPVPPAQDPQDEARRRRERDARIRTQFGSSVIISPEGDVTKQYSLSGEAALVFLNLLREPQAAAAADPGQGVVVDSKSQSVLARMLGDHQVKITYFKDFEPIVAGDIVTKITGALPPLGQPQSNSLILVTAKPSGLEAFEDTLNLFFSNIPQIEIEVKVVEFATADATSIGITTLAGEDPPPTFSNTAPERLVRNITSQFPLPSTLLSSDSGTITLGGVHDRWELNARLQLLEINNAADVLSQPKLVVRNGGIASVSTVTQVPFPKAKFTSSGSNVVTDIEFKPVGITLNIRPVIAGTDTVILQVYAKVSAVTGSTPTDPVPVPTISEREVVTQVHVGSGQATTIGGLLSKGTLEAVNKIPILGDIPILGYLFRSSSKQVTRTNVEFVIIPTIKMGAERGESIDPLNPIGG